MVFQQIYTFRYLYKWSSNLALQEGWHLLNEVLDNGIGTPLDLEPGGNGVQFDGGIDRLGDFVDLFGLLIGPHRSAELLVG